MRTIFFLVKTVLEQNWKSISCIDIEFLKTNQLYL